MKKFLTTLLCFSAITQNYSMENPLIYNLVEGLPNLFLDPLSEKIGCTWINGNVWDKPLIRKYYSVLHDHDNFFVAFDVGAQTGSFSLLAKYFPNSQWYAFEPIQEAAQTLKTNLSLNDINNVSVFQIAASNVSGSATLQLPQMDAWGLSTLGSNVLRFTPTSTRNIQCMDLDSFAQMNNIQHVDFIKIDTEGWELYVLQGAKQLITRDHPTILLEHNDTNIKQCNSSREQIESLLSELNYDWTLVSSEDILCVPRINTP